MHTGTWLWSCIKVLLQERHGVDFLGVSCRVEKLHSSKLSWAAAQLVKTRCEVKPPWIWGSKVNITFNTPVNDTIQSSDSEKLYQFLCCLNSPPCNMQSYVFLSLLLRGSQNPVGSAPSSHSRMVTLLLLWRPASRGQLKEDKDVPLTDADCSITAGSEYI